MSSYFAILFSYCALEQLFKNSPYQAPWNTKRFIFISAWSGLLLLVMSQDAGNLGLLNEGDPYHRNFFFYAYQYVYYTGVIWLVWINIRVVWDTLYEIGDTSQYIRWILLLVGFSFALFGVGVVAEISLFISILSGDTYRSTFSDMYHISFVVSFLMIAIGVLAPKKIYTPLADIFERNDEKLLLYLSNKLLQIVPDVRFKNEQIRMSMPLVASLIEISDARRIIWSNTAHYKNIVTTFEEAQRFMELIANRAEFKAVGPYILPSVFNGSERRHYIAVAKKLKKAERSMYTKYQI
jgi:hypothetical protein